MSETKIPTDCPKIIDLSLTTCRNCENRSNCKDELMIKLLQTIAESSPKRKTKDGKKHFNRLGLPIYDSDPTIAKKIDRFVDLVSIVKTRLEEEGLISEEYGDTNMDVLIGFCNSYLEYHRLFDNIGDFVDE